MRRSEARWSLSDWKIRTMKVVAFGNNEETGDYRVLLGLGFNWSLGLRLCWGLRGDGRGI